MKSLSFLVLSLFVFLSGSCRKDFLISEPVGDLNKFNLATDKGIETLLVGAYSMLDGVSSEVGGWESASSNWVFGSIRGMEANFGSDEGDQGDKNSLQNFNETSTQSYLNIKWREIYEAVSRCNSVIVVINQALASGKIDQSKADMYLGQARALRGWYHFEAWRMWKMIPYIDEKTDAASATNTEDISSKIIDDLSAGIALTENMGSIGKFNGTVVKVLLAKVLMQMNHDYSAALVLLEKAKDGTKPDGSPIGLAPTYGEIFDIVNRNGIESVYTVQYSVNDGSLGWNGGYGEVLNFPYKNGPAGCCGFFQPTQEFVNSFRTSGGLPLLDNSYSLNPVKNDEGIVVSTLFIPDTGPLDPRLDWTVGRRGIPYWDWGLHTGADWIRNQEYAGPYSPKKQVYKKSDAGIYTEIDSWTQGFTANGYRMIRFSDILLLLAECQIETNDLAGALININAIRSRAANPAGWVKMPDGTNAANYQISVYPAFPDQDYARKALRMERKLELGLEGHRYFDLNRWNITVDELNRVLTYEKSMPWGHSLYWDAIVGPEDVTFPIPQHQIDISSGNLVQNR